MLILKPKQVYLKKIHIMYRTLVSRRPKVSCKKVVLKDFTKFTGKHLCQSLFFNKVWIKNFLKKEKVAQVFSCEFWERFMNFFLYRTPLQADSDLMDFLCENN